MLSLESNESAAALRISQLTGGRKGEKPGNGTGTGFAVTLKIQSENSVIYETVARADASKD